MAWYENFFDDWYLKYWMAWITPEHTAEDIDAAVRFLDLAPGARVLDLCCGQGRHVLELARRGYHVTGVDLSDTLLAEARRQAQQENSPATFLQCDMRKIDFENQFDAVINFYTAFGYFEEDEDNQAVLNAVARALKPQGRFLLDYPCLEGRMPTWKSQRHLKFPDGTVLLHDLEHDVFNQTIKNTALYITADNTRHQTGFTLRHYYGRELRQALQSAGLNVLATYGDRSGKTLQNTDTRILLIAQKP